MGQITVGQDRRRVKNESKIRHFEDSRGSLPDLSAKPKSYTDDRGPDKGHEETVLNRLVYKGQGQRDGNGHEDQGQLDEIEVYLPK